jgi:hypothetical protein
VATAAYPDDPDLADPSRWRTLPATSAYGHLEHLAVAAVEGEVLDVLPESLDEGLEGDYGPRARVIGERLWLLGYFTGGREWARALFARDRAAFLEAVSRFQRDARLEADAWTGPRTWRALEQLVKFEGGPLPEAWLGAERWPVAVLRAAQLRLHTLGLGAGKPGPRFDQPSRRAIRRFHRMLIALRLVGKDHGKRLDVITLPLLLDQEGLTRAVADLAVPSPSGDGLRFRFFQSGNWDAASHREDMRQFLVQLVKVEFWLLGIDVDIGGRDDYPVRSFGVLRPRRRPERYALGRALLVFHEQLLGLSGDDARERSRCITPELFRTLANVDETPAQRSSEQAYSLVLSRLESQEDVDAALEEGRSLGMRVWDGMKRLWRRFRRMIGAAARRLIELGRNLGRIFYRYAAKGFQILRRAINAVTQSVAAWSRGGLALGDSHVRIHRDVDLDLYLPGSFERRLGTRIALFGHRFLFACRILRIVLVGIVAGSLQQWARLARSLVVGLADLIPLYREIQRAEAILDPA